jgi:hypothetical protein
LNRAPDAYARQQRDQPSRLIQDDAVRLPQARSVPEGKTTIAIDARMAGRQGPGLSKPNTIKLT